MGGKDVVSAVPRPYPDVLILGAGFSKALSKTMPLTDDLGNELVTDLRDLALGRALPDHFHGGQFEAWLSRLAEEQPDLSPTENIANRYLFAQCSELLAARLEQHVAAACDDPDGQLQSNDGRWLPTLLGTMHARQATVITFNQDVLLELAVQTAALRCWDARRWSAAGPQPEVRWWDLLDGQPRLPTSRWAGLGGVPQLTFRLLKLHGSTNWYWIPGDTTGGSVACWFLPGELAPEQAIPDEVAARERELPGRVPLIVPPAAGKSSYYRTPALSQLWQNARRALSQPAVHVSIVGYSLPLTDLSTAGMLREALGPSRPDVPGQIEVINPDAEPVLRNLEALGIESPHVDVIDSVADFTERYQARSAADVLALLRREDRDTDRYLLAGPNIGDGRKVVDIAEHRGGALQLMLETCARPYTGTNIGREGAPEPLQVRRLLAAIAATGATCLEVVAPGDRRRPVIALAEHTTNVGAGDGRWLVLITALPVL
jgi:hypothetical protein